VSPANPPCVSCGAALSPGDAFCEACGAAAPIDVAARAAPGDVAAADPTRTVLTAAPGDPEPPGGAAPNCTSCGSTGFVDGFCAVCGQRRRTARDHWVEVPAPWVGAVCDKGIAHARNEDAMAVSAEPGGARAALVVCDGVTSAPESDRASLAAARAACAVLTGAVVGGATSDERIAGWEVRLREACAAAQAGAVAVAHLLGGPPEPPSCTFVAAVVDARALAVAWCGDSRAYWLPDDGDGVQLGLDHSLATELMRAGATREEAEADPTSHTITRWLGADSVDPTPEVSGRHLDAPGWVLVCSDGMWNYASTPAELRSLVDVAAADGAATPVALAESLAAWANDRGGHDNVTVVLARVDAPVP